VARAGCGAWESTTSIGTFMAESRSRKGSFSGACVGVRPRNRDGKRSGQQEQRGNHHREKNTAHHARATYAWVNRSKR
jgi:hypothetical protein